ncbi:MAG: phosphonate C-P lyase system protein PhnG [Desulfuromonadales bacterium]|nr:phosphonate C-P lyase system protein PhnG [Desulfuromonadales bacterium]
MIDIARQEWAAALSALPTKEVKEAAESFASSCQVRDVTLPQSGLGLLTLRDGAFHEAFHLGEVPVARAHVLLRTPDGQESSGGAILIDDRATVARAIAILDGALAGRLPGWEAVAALVERGYSARAEKFAVRKQIMASTRVDFSLLGQADEEEGDE